MIIYILDNHLSGCIKNINFYEIQIIYSCNNKTMTKNFYSILENQNMNSLCFIYLLFNIKDYYVLMNPMLIP